MERQATFLYKKYVDEDRLKREQGRRTNRALAAYYEERYLANLFTRIRKLDDIPSNDGISTDSSNVLLTNGQHSVDTTLFSMKNEVKVTTTPEKQFSRFGKCRTSNKTIFSSVQNGDQFPTPNNILSITPNISPKKSKPIATSTIQNMRQLRSRSVRFEPVSIVDIDDIEITASALPINSTKIDSDAQIVNASPGPYRRIKSEKINANDLPLRAGTTITSKYKTHRPLSGNKMIYKNKYKCDKKEVANVVTKKKITGFEKRLSTKTTVSPSTSSDDEFPCQNNMKLIEMARKFPCHVELFHSNVCYTVEKQWPKRMFKKQTYSELLPHQKHKLQIEMERKGVLLYKKYVNEDCLKRQSESSTNGALEYYEERIQSKSLIASNLSSKMKPIGIQTFQNRRQLRPRSVKNEPVSPTDVDDEIEMVSIVCIDPMKRHSDSQIGKATSRTNIRKKVEKIDTETMPMRTDTIISAKSEYHRPLLQPCHDEITVAGSNPLWTTTNIQQTSNFNPVNGQQSTDSKLFSVHSENVTKTENKNIHEHLTKLQLEMERKAFLLYKNRLKRRRKKRTNCTFSIYEERNSSNSLTRAQRSSYDDMTDANSSCTTLMNTQPSTTNFDSESFNLTLKLGGNGEWKCIKNSNHENQTGPNNKINSITLFQSNDRSIAKTYGLRQRIKKEPKEKSTRKASGTTFSEIGVAIQKRILWSNCKKLTNLSKLVINAKVFAKQTGHPPWPGQILEFTKNNTSALVMFYGFDKSIGTVKINELVQLDEETKPAIGELILFTYRTKSIRGFESFKDAIREMQGNMVFYV